MSHFTIDFFELSFLAEACVPPVPIARSMFWDSLINTHYHAMSKDERASLFDFSKRLWHMDYNNEDVKWFVARFDPDNQYRCLTKYDGKKVYYEAFLKDGKYYTQKNKWIAEEYIIKIEKI